MGSGPQSINTQEIEHFAKDSSHWWDENGPFAPLHKLNPVRLQYICDQIRQHYDLDEHDLKPFKGLKILDIGCGGGLICEPMTRLSASMTGVDADGNAIAVARDHAKKSDLKIDYKHQAAEDLKKTFDVVFALEIVEHVNNVDDFVQSCFDLCKPGGLVIFSTLNRTPKSFALGIVAAEYIMRWVPRGTHQWKKFIRPSELSRMIRAANGQPKNVKGLHYNPIRGEFELSDKDMNVNYFITAEKI